MIRLSILVLFIGVIGHQTASKRSNRAVNLYEAEKEIGVIALDQNNFDKNVYNSSRASLVEFYAHWCGACKKVKWKIVELAKRTRPWHGSVVRVLVVNCGDSVNENLCQQHEITAYPSLRLFGPGQEKESHRAALATMQIESIEAMMNGLIDFVHDRFHSPNLKNFASKHVESIFNGHKNTKYAILVFEKKDSYFGKKLILDFAGHQNEIVIRRTTLESNSSLITRYNIDTTHLPKVYLIDRIQKTPKLLDYKLLEKTRPDLDLRQMMSEISDSKSKNGDEEEVERTKYSKMIAKLIETPSSDVPNSSPVSEQVDSSQPPSSDETVQGNQENEERINLENILDKVYMHDLESGLHLMLRSDISHSRTIGGHKLQALKEWMRVLAKYFPGRNVVRNYLTDLSNKVSQVSELTGNEWKELTDETRENSFLPHVEEWRHCLGSQPKYRGYPCSLWSIFHVLTVAQVEQETSKPNSFENFNVTEVIGAIRLFVKYFFTCKECSDNFAAETRDYTNHLNEPTDAILYLWKIHNRVNKRLANEIGQDHDPKFPKTLFPSSNQCPKCRENDQTVWNYKEVVHYLSAYYSRTNLVEIDEADVEIEERKRENNGEEENEEKHRLEDDESLDENKESDGNVGKKEQTTASKLMSVLEVFSMRNGSNRLATCFDGFSLVYILYLIISLIVNNVHS